MRRTLFPAAIALVFTFALLEAAIAQTEIQDGEVFRANFDFSAEPAPPVDVMVRFNDVVMTPNSALETWTVSLFDDPATKIDGDLQHTTNAPEGPFTIEFSFSLNCPCTSGLPQELSDQKGFFQTTASGGRLSFANAVAVYRYFQQPGTPEISQPIVFTRVIPEPASALLLLQLASVVLGIRRASFARPA
jgi:hypothetical protein